MITSRPGHALLVLCVCLLLPVSAFGSQPSYGTADVDGIAAEWDLNADYFANLYRAGNANKKIEARAYLRYDCTASTLYVLVLGVDGVPLLTPSPNFSWAAIGDQSNKVYDSGTTGDDGIAPDFAWVNHAPGDSLADGYEASFAIEPGDWEIILHSDVFDDAGSQTSATTGFPSSGIPLSLQCSTPVEAATWGRIKTTLSDR